MSVGRNTTTRDRHRKLAARGKPPCHICNEPIDYGLPHLDPGAYVIDHVVPIHRGGADSIENVRPAHRSCNRDKSDKVGDELMPARVFVTSRSW